MFDDPKYKNCVESDKHPADFVTAFGPDGLPLPMPDDGKKKRGRPKKNKIILNENGEPVQVGKLETFRKFDTTQRGP